MCVCACVVPPQWNHGNSLTTTGKINKINKRIQNNKTLINTTPDSSPQLCLWNIPFKGHYIIIPIHFLQETWIRKNLECLEVHKHTKTDCGAILSNMKAVGIKQLRWLKIHWIDFHFSVIFQVWFTQVCMGMDVLSTIMYFSTDITCTNFSQKENNHFKSFCGNAQADVMTRHVTSSTSTHACFHIKIFETTVYMCSQWNRLFTSKDIQRF